MSKSKQKGTLAETSVVEYLRSRGWKRVERRTLGGVNDKGDIAGFFTETVDTVIEVKNCVKMELAGWMKEAAIERVNAAADIGVVWSKKRGTTNPAEWYVIMTGEEFVDLVEKTRS